MREVFAAQLKDAMKGGDKETTATIRLIQSAIKNRDIELRTASTQPESSCRCSCGRVASIDQSARAVRTSNPAA